VNEEIVVFQIVYVSGSRAGTAYHMAVLAFSLGFAREIRHPLSVATTLELSLAVVTSE
jgi:hypothetical protein